MPEYIYFTKYTSEKGPVTKIYWTDKGEIKKDTTHGLYQGNAKKVKATFLEFKEELINAKSHHVFGYGLHEDSYPDLVEITTDGKEQPNLNILSRTKKFYEYRQRPGILMLDHDVDQYGKHFTPKELIAALISIDPNLEYAAMIVRESVSAGVHLKGNKPSSNHGFHIYIPVNDASDIPRYGKLLFEKLWLKGYGYIKPSSNGYPIFRTAIDGLVFSGERIDMVGEPILISDQLTYKAPRVIFKEGKFLDTRKLIDLTPVEEKKVAHLKQSAINEFKPQERKIKSKWKKDRTEEVSNTRKISKESAKKLVESVLKDNANLYGEWPLYFDNGDIISVIELLEKPEQYDGLSLADPIDGPNKVKRGKAKFWWNNGKPIIHSFAHGSNSNYYLTKSSNKKYIEGIDAYYDNREYISKEDAQKLMQRSIKKWMHTGDQHFAIAAPAGIGKTTMIVKEVADYAKNNLVEIYVPRHDLANEIKQKLLAENNSLKVIVVRGRTHSDETDSEPPCKKHKLIESIQDYGYNIHQDVCTTCPFVTGKAICDYLRQFSNDSQVRIYTHKHLSLLRKYDKTLPAKAIIDERFFTDLIEIKKTRISLVENFISNKKKLSSNICYALEFNEPLLKYLKKKYKNELNTVVFEAQLELSEYTLPEIDANTDPNIISDQLKAKKIKVKKVLWTMLEQLLYEIKLFPDRDHSLTVRRIEEEIVIVNRLNINRFSNQNQHTPVLCIDADYSQSISKLFLPGITKLEIAVKRHAEVCQIYSATNAKMRFFLMKTLAII